MSQQPSVLCGKASTLILDLTRIQKGALTKSMEQNIDENEDYKWEF